MDAGKVDMVMKRDWYVLHVKPRTEKKVVAYLAKYDCFRYLPVCVKITKVQRRKKRTEIPLFPGYVFTRLNPDERIKMLQTNLLVQTIPVPYPRSMIHQLRQIAHMARGGVPLRTVAPIKAGDFIRVKYGPFRGVEGYVKREGAEAKIVVNVDILGQAVEMSISPADCEVVPTIKD